jgi:hypothetical protein
MGKPTLATSVSFLGRAAHRTTGRDVPTVWARSTFERAAFVTVIRMTSIGGPPASTISRRALASPGMDEAGNHVSIEPVGEHKQVLGDAMRNATEQLKRTALFRQDVGQNLLMIDRREPVGHRSQEAHDCILLCFRKAQPPHAFCVHVGGRLRCGPARRALAWVIGLATRLLPHRRRVRHLRAEYIHSHRDGRSRHRADQTY